MIKPEHLSDAVVCSPEDSILEVSKILRDTQSRSLIVIDNKQRPLGIISASDIVNRCIACEDDCKNSKAKDIMTKELEKIELTTPFEEIIKDLHNHRVLTLPVTKDEKIIGMVDLWTILHIALDRGE